MLVFVVEVDVFVDIGNAFDRYTGIENYSVCSKGTQNTQSSNFSFQVGAKLGQNSDTGCISVLKFKFVKLIISIFECKVWFCLNNLCREYA